MWIVRIGLVFTILLINAAPARAALDPVQAARLAQQLRDAHYARIGIEGRTHVLIRPQVGREGLRYEQVEMSPRRQSFLAGTGRDSVAPQPPNPVPWSRIERIESGVRTRLPGILTGGSIGLVTGALLGVAAESAYEGGSGPATSTAKGALIVGALFGVVGAGIGALVPSTRWMQVYPEAQESPPPLAEQLREAHFARISIEAKTLVLVKPHLAPEGLAYGSVQGHPRRPAIVVGAGWDSVARLPNPIPWDRIEQIEAGKQSRRTGVLIGGALGVITGFIWGLNGDSFAPSLELGALLGVAGAGLGALFPTTKWEPVYPQPQR